MGHSASEWAYVFWHHVTIKNKMVNRSVNTAIAFYNGWTFALCRSQSSRAQGAVLMKELHVDSPSRKLSLTRPPEEQRGYWVEPGSLGCGVGVECVKETVRVFEWNRNNVEQLHHIYLNIFAVWSFCIWVQGTTLQNVWKEIKILRQWASVLLALIRTF